MNFSNTTTSNDTSATFSFAFIFGDGVLTVEEMREHMGLRGQPRPLTPEEIEARRAAEAAQRAAREEAREAALKDLKTRYRKLALIHHPDHGGDKATMQRLNAWYEANKRRIQAA